MSSVGGLHGQTSDTLDSVFQSHGSTTLFFNRYHCCHLLNAYYVMGSVQSILYVFSHLIFVSTL